MYFKAASNAENLSIETSRRLTLYMVHLLSVLTKQVCVHHENVWGRDE